MSLSSLFKHVLFLYCAFLNANKELTTTTTTTSSMRNQIVELTLFHLAPDT